MMKTEGTSEKEFKFERERTRWKQREMKYDKTIKTNDILVFCRCHKFNWNESDAFAFCSMKISNFITFFFFLAHFLLSSDRISSQNFVIFFEQKIKFKKIPVTVDSIETEKWLITK